jgi:hypothetical protein
MVLTGYPVRIPAITGREALKIRIEVQFPTGTEKSSRSFNE